MTNLAKWKIGWGITNLCNMSCPFCYSLNARKGNADLPLVELKRFVDRNHQFIESINYGTGENTLVNDWFELLHYVQEEYISIKQALTTNGFLTAALDSRKEKEIILSALDEVDVSLDFHEKERHNKFRKNDMAYDWAVRSIEICREYNIKTTIVILGVNETLEIENLSKIFELAQRNQCYVRINIYRPNIKQGLPLLSYNILKKALIYILKNHSVISLCDPLFSAIVFGEEKKDLSGKASLRILPDGYITPSTYLVSKEWKRAHINEAFLGDSKLKESLQKGWDIENNPIEECQLCELKDMCKGGAIDRRVIWFDNLNMRDPYCPDLNNDSLKDWEFKKNNTITGGPEIHDGYLPTLIFAP